MTSSLSERDLTHIYDLLTTVAAEGGKKLRELSSNDTTRHHFDPVWQREVKAEADCIIESVILRELKQTQIPIVSEESGLVNDYAEHDYRIFLDPIDGTANFVRGVGDASVSIALCKNDEPIFGVLSVFPTDQLVWGGPGIGAFIDGDSINVSTQSTQAKSILCTGIPSRFDLSDKEQAAWFIGQVVRFGKIRMFGAASISLLKVAKGSADAYMERDIMFWDVAAGLAIVLGAGGYINVSSGTQPFARDVVATNGRLSI